MIAAYVLQWQSSAMPGPAFWYFETRRQAEAAARQLGQDTRTEIREVKIPECRAQAIQREAPIGPRS